MPIIMALKEIITVLILILSHLILSHPICLTMEMKTKEKKKKSGFNTHISLNYLNFIFYSAVQPSSLYIILFYCFMFHLVPFTICQLYLLLVWPIQLISSYILPSPFIFFVIFILFEFAFIFFLFFFPPFFSFFSLFIISV